MIVIRVGWVRRRTGRTTSTTRQTATNSASYSFSLEGKVSLKCKNLILLYRKWKYLTHRVENVVVHNLESESIFVNPPKLRSDSLSFRAAQTITFHCKNTVAFRNPRVRTSPIFLKTSSTSFSSWSNWIFPTLEIPRQGNTRNALSLMSWNDLEIKKGGNFKYEVPLQISLISQMSNYLI